MKSYACRAEGVGYSGLPCPEELKASILRGKRIVAGAWRKKPVDFEFVIIIDTETSLKESGFRDMLNRKTGTIGKALPGASSFNIKECKETAGGPLVDLLPREGGWCIILDRSKSSTAMVVMAGEVICDDDQASALANAFQVMNLSTNSTLEEVRARRNELYAKHHPDKGGNVEAFVRVVQAHERISAVTRDGTVICVPKETPLDVRSNSDDVHAEIAKLKAHKVNLETQLMGTKKRLQYLEREVIDVQKRAQKKAIAEAFVAQHFQMSAKYWCGDALQRWFQPGQYLGLWVPAPKLKEYFADMETQLGPYLREGHEALDPYMEYIAWRPTTAPKPCTGFGHSEIQIVVGLDRIDAIDHGKTLWIPEQALSFSPHWENLKRRGFEHWRMIEHLQTLRGVRALDVYELDIRVGLTLVGAQLTKRRRILVDTPAHASVSAAPSWSRLRYMDLPSFRALGQSRAGDAESEGE